MRLEKTKKLFQKLIISICLVLMMFAFLMPNYSHADVGGILMKPICEFLAALGDGGNYIISALVGEPTDQTLDRLKAYNQIKYWAEVYDRAKALGLEDKLDLENEIKVVDGKDISAVTFYPNIKITPIEIFKNKIALLDSNFFDNSTNSEYNSEKLGGTENSIARKLKGIIAGWYNTFRLVAVVGLLTVLIYLGIRIVISSAAEDKAKYKERIVDWLVALCLVFFMHYIMVFTTTIITEILDLVGGQKTVTFKSTDLYVDPEKFDEYATDWGRKNIEDYDQKMDEITKNLEEQIGQINSEGNASQINSTNSSSSMINEIDKELDNKFNTAIVPELWVNVVDEQGKTKKALANGEVYNQDTEIQGYGYGTPLNTKFIFGTNLTGYVRFMIDSKDWTPKLGYTIIYLALTFYTIYFFFIYIKRLVTLTFLTVIAPLVALTYPIDKVRDGNAQAFSFWLREYLINSILPIIHLILYTVLVSSTIMLAASSLIYAVAVLAFIVPAEKIVRKMFGIESEMSPPGGLATGALAATALGALKKTLTPGKKKGSKDGSKKSSDGEKGKIHFSKNSLEGYKKSSENKKSSNSSSKNTSNNKAASTSNKKKINVNVKQEAPAKKKINQPSMANNAAKMIRRKYKIPKGGKGALALSKKAAKGGAKLAVRGATTITGASIGLAAGIVSGNMNDIWKGASIGAGAGLAIGGLADNVIDNGAQNLSDIAYEIKNGEDALEYRKGERDFINDYDNIKYVEDSDPELSGKEVENQLKEMYKYSGMSKDATIKEMDKAYKIEQEEFEKLKGKYKEEEARAKAQERAMKAAKYRNVFGDVANDKKKYDEAMKTLTEKKKLDKHSAEEFLRNVAKFHEV